MEKFSAFTLKDGARYRVIREFTNFDGGTHPVGETWRYTGKNFFPYDAGLTLSVECDTGMTSVRLQDYPEAQGPVIDHFSDYVEEVPQR